MASPPDEPDWDERVAELRSRLAVPAALANADILEQAARRWRGKVVPRTSMHDLLFTLPGDRFPFSRFVRVAFSPADETHTFTLRASDTVEAEEQARSHAAPDVLDAFLRRLVGNPI